MVRRKPVDFVDDDDEPEQHGRTMSISFIDDEPEPATPPSAPQKVRVLGNYRVVHDGIAYSDNAVVEVPADLAAHWLKNTWVTEV